MRERERREREKEVRERKKEEVALVHGSSSRKIASREMLPALSLVDTFIILNPIRC